MAGLASSSLVWGSEHFSVSTEVKYYRAYLLPILQFESRKWALTQEQAVMLERVHTSCLKNLLEVTLSERHRNAHARYVCGVASLHITDYKLAPHL